jgi:hypothetical protein
MPNSSITWRMPSERTILHDDVPSVRGAVVDAPKMSELHA